MKKTISLIFTALFLSVVGAFAASEEKIARQFEAKPNGKLVVNVDFGKIDVSPGADDKVVIDAFRKIDFGNEAKEKEYLSDVPITITAEGNTVTVKARAAKEKRYHNRHHSTMDGNYTIHVPKNFDVKLDTGGGSIAARELNGELRAESGGGKLTFAQLHGARSANTGGSSIELNNCDGATEVETGGGDISASGGQGTMRAHTGGGAIDVRNFLGDIDVETGGGEIILERVAGRISGETGGGSITASISGNVANEINLDTSGGSIDLTLPVTAAVDIDAETSSGRIKTNLPLETTRADEDHLRGKLNGGGKRVVLRSSAGSISIKSANGETAAR